MFFKLRGVDSEPIKKAGMAALVAATSVKGATVPIHELTDYVSEYKHWDPPLSRPILHLFRYRAEPSQIPHWQS